MTINPAQKKISAFILLIACINLFMGCSRFYRPIDVNAPTPENKQATIVKLNEEGKYFILRKGGNSYTLKNVKLDQSNLTLTADISEVPPTHQLYLSQNKKTGYRYQKSKFQEVVLKEVHLFVNDTAHVNLLMPYTTSLNNIEKIEVLEFDQQKTKSSYTKGTVGLILGVGIVIAIIAALASKPDPEPVPPGSCPYVSSYNGHGYTLHGEIYSAAIFPSLQKEDYLPLYTEPIDGKYRIKISNDLEEVQHTDFADLVVVEHNNNVKVLMDPQGKIYTVSQQHVPGTALLNNRTDVSRELALKDNTNCLFNDKGAGNSEDLYLTFNNDSMHTTGKLILNAKTSSWFNYLYDEFSKGFGNSYNKWAKEQEKKPASELKKWSDEQNIPLTIYAKTNNGWKEVQKIDAIGPLLPREIAIPLDNLPANVKVELKISTGFMFWELDYAAIDFTQDDNYTVYNIKPVVAFNETGKNVLPEIKNADKIFLTQPHTGDSTILEYNSIAGKPGMSQTVFFHTSGYYEHPRNHPGKPKLAFLKSFKKPGAMSAFSKQKYFEAWNNLATVKN